MKIFELPNQPLYLKLEQEELKVECHIKKKFIQGDWGLNEKKIK